ncbi:CBS domain-containing protein [Labrys sp. LIt4]|uniref:CBS domain-containing protein n=1 Tax=Labrys okinawensis TaxID=346911 RepID=A0A2S9QJ01_9HYPH|nr:MULTISPECIES: CBS domain-containing protein [Labrys]MBP0581231.1 CBS domain-containing protein [Labrys sp. LIt4]PRH89290.1 CBS domain-containing protein [Labrys okinawensis]
MKIRQAMTTEVCVATPDETIQKAAQLMLGLDIGMLPVAHADRLVGMITDRDIAVRGVAAGRGAESLVRDVMTADVKYCFDDEEIEDVLDNLGEIQVRRLPVVNRDKRLVGIVSLSDLARTHETDKAGAALSEIARPGGEHSQATF